MKDMTKSPRGYRNGMVLQCQGVISFKDPTSHFPPGTQKMKHHYYANISGCLNVRDNVSFDGDDL